MVLDPIGNMLVMIKNANQRKHKQVKIPHSKIKQEIARILLEEGYISDFKVEDAGVKKSILITLKYKGSTKVITGLKRVSKPGLKVYSEADKLPQVMNGFGLAIVSTSKGLMNAENAKKAKLGGEVLAFVW